MQGLWEASIKTMNIWKYKSKQKCSNTFLKSGKWKRVKASTPSKQPNNSNYLVLKVLEWNARSIKSRFNLDFLWYFTNERASDRGIIVETWLDEKIWILNTNYEAVQTDFNKYQGVCILGKRELQIRIENEDTAKEYILTRSVRSSGKIIAYIIGIYRKKESKEKNNRRN